MTQFTRNWLQFFRDKRLQNIPSDALFNLYSMMVNIRPGTIIPNSRIYEVLEQNNHYFSATLETLNEIGIISLEWKCPECLEMFDYSGELITECDFCGQEFTPTTLKNIVTYQEPSFNSEELLKRRYSFDANLLVESALSNGSIIYVHSDIVSSQKKQANDKSHYHNFLRKLSDEIWPIALTQSNRASLPLMFKGDACNLVFIDPADVNNVLVKFKNLIQGSDFKFSFYISQLTFTAEDRSGFYYNLEKRWDLNSSEVDIFFRKVQNLTIAEWADCPNHDLRICLFDQLADLASSVFNVSEEQAKINHRSITAKGKVYNLRYLAYCT